MLETFLFIYGAVVVAGSWLMLTGVASAPVGYEDEDGFHFEEPEKEEIPVEACEIR